MKAIILAAGFAKRMRPLTNNTHKTLLNVGSVPVINRIVDGLIENNISDIDEEYLLAPFSRTTDPDSSMQGIKEKWDELAKTNPEIKAHLS